MDGSMMPGDLQGPTILRIEADGAGRNRIACGCGRVRHFPASFPFRGCTFRVPACDECRVAIGPTRLILVGEGDQPACPVPSAK
jgi:hypothetical protein